MMVMNRIEDYHGEPSTRLTRLETVLAAAARWPFKWIEVMRFVWLALDTKLQRAHLKALIKCDD